MIRPLAGQFFVTAGWALDRLADVKEAAIQQLKSQLGVSSVPLLEKQVPRRRTHDLDELYKEIVDVDAVK